MRSTSIWISKRPFRTYNLALDVDQLNLQQWLGFDPGQFLDLSLTAPVTVAANVDLHLGFGFDLSNVFDPSFYVDADTGITASASGVAPDIDAKLSIDIPAIGPVDLPALGLYIVDGSAEIQVDFYANLGDPAADADGDGRISPMALGTAFQAGLTGSAVVDLPIYFPTASLPLGGTTTGSRRQRRRRQRVARRSQRFQWIRTSRCRRNTAIRCPAST